MGGEVGRLCLLYRYQCVCLNEHATIDTKYVFVFLVSFGFWYSVGFQASSVQVSSLWVGKFSMSPREQKKS